MAFDGTTPERAYPYWAGWYSTGCSVAFFGILGSVAVSLIPLGYEKLMADQLPTGVAILVFGLFGIPTLLTALVYLAGGVRNTFRPPLIRVTATGIELPRGARGEPPEDEYGQRLSRELPQPEAIPFAAIRSVKRHGPRFNEMIEVGHDLSQEPLQIRQPMMTARDFNDLEAALRAAVPEAFAAAPPTTP